MKCYECKHWLKQFSIDGLLIECDIPRCPDIKISSTWRIDKHAEHLKTCKNFEAVEK